MRNEIAASSTSLPRSHKTTWPATMVRFIIWVYTMCIIITKPKAILGLWGGLQDGPGLADCFLRLSGSTVNWQHSHGFHNETGLASQPIQGGSFASEGTHMVFFPEFLMIRKHQSWCTFLSRKGSCEQLGHSWGQEGLRLKDLERWLCLL